MIRFRYEARDAYGQPATGELVTGSRDEAEHQLRARGLTRITLTPMEWTSPTASAGNGDMVLAAEVMDAVSQFGGSGLTLAAGMRMAADESINRRAAKALRSIAADLEQGRSLNDALTHPSHRLPSHVRGLVLAAARTGRLDEALDELVEQQRVVRETFLGVWQAISYPLFVLGLSLVLLLAIPLLIVPEFQKMFMEFELSLPAMTQLMFAISDLVHLLLSQTVLGVIAAVLSAGVLAWVLMWWLAGGAAARRVLYAAPVIGRLWQWAATAEFTQLLAVLLEAEIPLSEALRLTGGGLRDANFREACRLMSESVERAQTLSGALTTAPGVPASLVPFVRWGEKTGDLPDALRTGGDLFLERVRLRGVLLRSISPPVVFVAVLAVVSLAVISLFLPLVSMIQGLS